MRATTLLHRDHLQVENLFRQIERSQRGREKRRKLIGDLQRALETHARIEEEIFYPALEKRREVAQMLREAYQEHALVKLLLREIAAMDPDDEQTEAKLEVLRENVEHHVEEEEGQLFRAAQGLGGARLEELGEQLAEGKRNASQGVGGRLVRNVRSLIFGEGEEVRPRRRSAGTSKRRSARSRSSKRSTRRASSSSQSRAGSSAGSRKAKRSAGRSKAGRARSASRTRGIAKKRMQRGRATRRRP